MDPANTSAAPSGSPLISLNYEPSRATSAPAIQPQQATGYASADIPSEQDVAKAHWNLDTVAGSAIMHITAGALNEADAERDPTFNPRRYARENPHAAAGLEAALASGFFDGALSKAQFQRLAEVARKQQQQREAIANGRDGNMLVNTAADLLDVTTLFGLGTAAAAKIGATSLLARAAAGAAGGALDAQVQNAALTSLVAGRTEEENRLNLGFTAALGAGFGALIKHLPPEHPLLRTGEDHPLTTENLAKQPVVEQPLGSSTAATFGPDSVGAARVGNYTEEATGREYAKPTGKVANAVDGLFQGLTPVQRSRSWLPEGQDAFWRLVDNQGLLLKGNLEGKGYGPSGEDLRTLYVQRGQQADSDVLDIFRKANADLGDAHNGASDFGKDMLRQWSTGALDVNSLKFADFEKALDTLNTGRGSKDPNVEQRVKALLTEALGGDSAKADKVYPRIFEASERQQRYYAQTWEDGVRHGVIDPEEVQRQDFYVPMLYNKAGIDKNPFGFTSLLLEHIHDKPQEEFLRKSGFIADPSVKLPEGAEPLPASWDELKTAHPERAAEAIKQWSGDAEANRAARLQLKEDAAAQRWLQAQDDAQFALDVSNAATKDLQKASLKQLKAEAQAQLQGAIVRNVAASTRAAEKAEAKVAAIEARIGDANALHAQLTADLQSGGHALDSAGAAARGAERSAADAQATVDFLRGERTSAHAERDGLAPQAKDFWQAARDLDEVKGRLKELNAQLREAVSLRDADRAALAEARADFERIAAGQRNTERWKAAVENDVRTLMQHEDHAALAPGFRDRYQADLDRLRYVQERLDAATAARYEKFITMRLMRKDMINARTEANASAWALRKAIWAKNKDARRTPAGQWAEQLTNHLRGNERAPSGFLWDTPSGTGRLKPKNIEWSPEHIQALSEAGYRETSPLHQSGRYTSDVGGQYAAWRALDGKPIDEVLADIQAHYDSAAANAKSVKEADRLRALGKDNADSVKAMHDRVLGRHEVRDDNAVTWIIDRLKQATMLRYQGGFVLNAVGDIATALYAARGYNPIMAAMRQDTAKLMKLAMQDHEGAKELLTFLQSLEHGAHLAFSDRQLANGAAQDLLGFGAYGSLQRKITGKIEAVMNAAGDTVQRVSGLKAFSDGIRRPAAFVQLRNIRDWAAKGWEALKPGVQADLAKLGIGRQDLAHLHALFKEHGEDVGHLFIPNTQKWISFADGSTNHLGSRMADVLNTALLRTQKRASFVAGFGSTPLLATTPMGRLFTQFQSYAGAFYNGFVRSAIQHGSLTGETSRTFMALAYALAAGEFTAEFSALRKGNDENQKLWDNPAYHAYQVIQRSGILGMAGTYLDVPIKLGSPTLKDATGVDLTAGAGKYSQNGALQGLAGAGFQTLTDASNVLGGYATGDTDAATKKLITLIPLNQQFKLLQRLAGVDHF